MAFMNWIVQRLSDVADFFEALYREAVDWVWPFYLTAGFFYHLSLLFSRLAWDFYDFGQGVDAAAAQLGDILSWSYIKSLIRLWLPGLEDAIAWWHNWTTFVGQRIDDWWHDIKNTILGLIDIAGQDLRSLIDDARAWLAGLQSSVNDLIDLLPGISELTAWFSNWWGNILSPLTSWWNSKILDVQGLINSAFTAREPFWSGWQDVRDKVIDFITSPLDWLFNRFTDWFLGPEK